MTQRRTMTDRLRLRLRPVAVMGAGVLVLTGCATDEADPPETVETTVTATVTPAPEETPDEDGDPTPAPTPDDEGSDDGASGDGSGDGSDEGPLPDEDPAGDEAPFPANRQPDTAETSDGARLSPVDLRFGVHEGYDRIVLDLEGEGSPGWLGEYVDEPTQQGSGRPVDLAGDAYLKIIVRGVMYPTEADAEEYEGPERLTPRSGGVVREVVHGSIFEGHQEIFVGLASEEPFRVFGLEDPTRVVIDVQHP